MICMIQFEFVSLNETAMSAGCLSLDKLHSSEGTRLHKLEPMVVILFCLRVNLLILSSLLRLNVVSLPRLGHYHSESEII